MKLLRYGSVGQEKLSGVKVNTLPLVDKNVRIGPWMSQPGKIMCIGYNSRLHTQQMGVTATDDSEMVVFLKPYSRGISSLWVQRLETQSFGERISFLK